MNTNQRQRQRNADSVRIPLRMSRWMLLPISGIFVSKKSASKDRWSSAVKDLDAVTSAKATRMSYLAFPA
jgi:hypothetical protein